MIPCRPGCFGKLPIHGDFLRHNPGPEVHRLDDLVQQGLRRSQSDLKDGWAEAYRAIPTLAFLRYFPDSQRFVAGVLTPSQDKAGRSFPFMVTCTLDDASVRRQPALLPLVCEGFWSRAAELAAADHTGKEYREVYAEVDALAEQVDPRAAERRLEGLLKDTSFEELLVDSLGAWDDRRYLLLLNMASLLAPRSRPRFALVLPGPADAAGAALWLALAGGLRGEPERFPLLSAWPWGGGSGGLRCVLVDPTGEHFAPIFMAHVPSDACELFQEGLESSSLLDKARSRFGTLGERRETPVGEVRDGLRRTVAG